MELTTTGILSLLQTDKAQRESFANDLIQRIENGEIDPILVHLQLKCMEQVVETAIGHEKYKGLLLEAAEKHGKSFEAYNGAFSIREVGTKYDYSKCEDSVYNDLIAEKEALDKEIKERAKFLQNIPESGIADPNNGNMIYRASKSSTTSVTVTIK